MKGDLISRSALRDYIVRAIEKQNGRGIDLLNVSEVLEVIDKQPTAYDLEKVVEQLEVSLIAELEDEIDAIYLSEAIDIVRNGGKAVQNDY